MTGYDQSPDYDNPDPARPSRADLFLALFVGALVGASALYLLFFN